MKQRSWIVSGLLETALLGSLLVLFMVHGSKQVVSPSISPAADLHAFDPGNIISDTIFWDSSAINAQDLQAFIQLKGSRCASTNGWCLKNLKQDTYTRRSPLPGTAGCAGDYIGASGESAATIIYKVSHACGVNPEVLLVTLQKESGVVTASSPWSGTYTHVMGFGCPDTAPCASTDNGFFNQVYKAANQFQRYKAGAAGSIRPGRSIQIGYYPPIADTYGDNTNDIRCGTETVYVQNQATAALYNYTPYVPNAAALNNEYGTGDTCSSYGNRNFYSYFNDWFNGPQAIRARASTAGLGPVMNDIWCDQPNGGCRQRFTYGDIYWSRLTGAHAVKGAILATFYSSGGPAYMGYPLGEEGQDTKVAGTYYSNFQQGDIVWNQTVGAHMVRGALLKNWQSWGASGGRLGLPTGDDTPIAGGSRNTFQRGTVYWSANTGAHAVFGAILAKYVAGDGPAYMGFPLREEGQDANLAGTYYSNFEQGDIVWNQSVGAHMVRGVLLTSWQAWGASGGQLGLPTGDDTPVAGGVMNDFQNGSLYWSANTGAHAVRGAILAKYVAGGGPAYMGFPLGEQGQDTNLPGTYYSNFDQGDIVWNQSVGAHMVRGVLLKSWQALGASGGQLGLPTGDDTPVAGGLMNDFQNGSIYWSASTGAHTVSGAILAKYQAQGVLGVLGFPVGEQTVEANDPNTNYVNFQNGDIIWSSPTGAHYLYGPILQYWKAAGGSTGSLGLPAGDQSATGNGGSGSDFQHGSVYWSDATSTHVVSGVILDKYRAMGGPVSLLGYPTGDYATAPGADGTYVNFQGGDMIWSAATGAHYVRGGILRYWQGAGAAAGYLGFPTADEVALPGGGYASDFSGGSIYWSRATSMHIVRGVILDKYRAMGGPVSLLGYPTGDYATAPGADGTYVNFQGGDVISSAAGAHYVRGGILRYWQGAGAAAGYLGFPTADEVALPGGGYASDFSGGSIYWSRATSMHIVRGAILDKYRAMGGPASLLGYPTGDYANLQGATEGAYVLFQGVDVVWSAADGAHWVRGDILSSWLRAGGASGPLGFPTADETPIAGGGAMSTFDGGTTYWSSTTGARWVLSAVDSKYRSAGGPTSTYGYPLSNTYAVSGGQRNDFQHGSLTG